MAEVILRSCVMEFSNNGSRYLYLFLLLPCVWLCSSEVLWHFFVPVPLPMSLVCSVIPVVLPGRDGRLSCARWLCVHCVVMIFRVVGSAVALLRTATDVVAQHWQAAMDPRVLFMGHLGRTHRRHSSTDGRTIGLPAYSPPTLVRAKCCYLFF